MPALGASLKPILSPLTRAIGAAGGGGGATLGPELVTNGTFDTNVTGWTFVGGVGTSSGGKYVGQSGSGPFYQDLTTPLGGFHQFSVEVDAIAGGDLALTVYEGGAFSSILGDTGFSAATGTRTFYFRPPTGSSRIYVRQSVFNGVTSTLDNISIKQYSRNPNPQAFALGDSTVAAYLEQTAVLDYVPATVTKRSIAFPGHTIAQQQEAWNADALRSLAKWAVIQVGLNDLAPAEAASTAIARLQTLVNTVGKFGAPVFISKMTPCRARLITLYGATDGPIAYQKWLDMNAAIAGGGATPITGVAGRITAHEPLLNDGSGNLRAEYDMGDGIHTNNAARIINAQAWTDVLTAAGLL